MPNISIGIYWARNHGMFTTRTASRESAEMKPQQNFARKKNNGGLTRVMQSYGYEFSGAYEMGHIQKAS
jgi:hypothetical protein